MWVSAYVQPSCQEFLAARLFAFQGPARGEVTKGGGEEISQPCLWLDVHLGSASGGTCKKVKGGRGISGGRAEHKEERVEEVVSAERYV